MNKKGFTITELLITLFIVGVVLSATYITYIKLLKGFKSESEKISTQIESLVGLEILRLDLEHVGYGTPKDETKLIIEWDKTNKQLTLRTTLNNTNQSTLGYIVAKCVSSNLNIKYDGREDSTNNYLSILNSDDKKFFSKGKVSGDDITETTSTCTNNKLYIAFPIREKVFNGTSDDCNIGLCEKITYKLSNSNLIDRCNSHTYNLVRQVGTSNTGGEPILNCVADWNVSFDIDTNGDGKIDSTEENLDGSALTDNSIIRNQLKRVNVYILVQEGKKDPEFTYNQVGTCGSGKCISIDGVNLNLPLDYIHYRWKPLKITVKPMDL